MNKVKQFMNKITEKGSPGSVEPSSGVLQPCDDTEEQLSAEGFLCPDCMTAFPSPESLANHYQTKHSVASAQVTKSLEFDSSTDLDSALAHQEILELQYSLEDERKHSAEMHREVMMLRNELESRRCSVSSSKSQEGFAEDDHEVPSFQDSRNQKLLEEIKKLSRDALERNSEFEKLKLKATRLERIVAIEEGNTKTYLQREELQRDEYRNLQKKLDEVQLNYNLAKNELGTFKSSFAEATKAREEVSDQLSALNEKLKAEIQSHAEAASSLTEELALMESKADLSAQECTELKQEVQRLRSKHNELISRIEGDEASQAAIQSLNKELETLKDALDSSQVQNRELSKNLHNIGFELEKSRKEYQALSLQFVEFKKENETVVQGFKIQLNENIQLIDVQKIQLSELKPQLQLLKANFEEEKIKVTSLTTQTDQLRQTGESLELTLREKEERYVEAKKRIDELINEREFVNEALQKSKLSGEKLDKKLEQKSTQLQNLEVELKETNLKNSRLETAMTSQEHENELKFEKSHKEYEKQNAEFELYKKETNSKVKKLTDDNVKLKNELDIEKRSNFNNQEKSSNMLKKVQEDLKDSVQKSDKLLEDLKTQKESVTLELTNMKKEMESFKLRYDEKDKLVKDYQRKLDAVNEELGVLREDTKRYQDERDLLQADKLDYDKKYKSSEEARALILERCLVGESEAERFQDTIQDLRRRLDDSLSALQELGRENQSLQVESAKLQGRRWADDSVVTSCCTCTKEFSITVRKHHCRVCGNIYCNECSSKTASIPSSKKPVRVCDACFEEFLTK